MCVCLYTQTFSKISSLLTLLAMYHSTYRMTVELTFENLGMGWLRLVGSFKLQVSFAEYRLFHKALLKKRPICLRSLLIVATPYLHIYICICLLVCLSFYTCEQDILKKQLATQFTYYLYSNYSIHLL